MRFWDKFPAYNHGILIFANILLLVFNVFSLIFIHILKIKLSSPLYHKNTHDSINGAGRRYGVHTYTQKKSRGVTYVAANKRVLHTHNNARTVLSKGQLVRNILKPLKENFQTLLISSRSAFVSSCLNFPNDIIIQINIYIIHKSDKAGKYYGSDQINKH